MLAKQSHLNAVPAPSLLLAHSTGAGVGALSLLCMYRRGRAGQQYLIPWQA